MYTVSWRASPRRSETRSDTRPNSAERRDSTADDEPVVGTMLDGDTNTGRPPSLCSVNFGVPAKLASITLG